MTRSGAADVKIRVAFRFYICIMERNAESIIPEDTRSMSPIKITCDSTCDLSPALYAQYGVEVIPLDIVLSEKVYRDGADISAAEIFAYAEKTGTLPKTSAISPAAYGEVFRRWRTQGYEVIHINISSELSACHQNARLAAEEIGGVYPIDSRNLSSGSGHLVLRAAELAAQGRTAQEIVQTLDADKLHLDVSFVLQRLDYLKMGGRCSGVTAFGANVLQLRPEIRVAEGQMKVGAKYRGSIHRSVSDYIRGRLEGRSDIDTHRIFITHAQAPEEVVAEAAALVRTLQPFEEVLVTRAGCTISSHCGPDCLGVLFFTR